MWQMFLMIFVVFPDGSFQVVQSAPMEDAVSCLKAAQDINKDTDMNGACYPKYIKGDST